MNQFDKYFKETITNHSLDDNVQAKKNIFRLL